MESSFIMRFQKAILIITTIIIVSIFFSNVSARSSYADPCAAIQGTWEGTMKLNHKIWVAHATCTIYPNIIRFGIDATLQPSNDPPIVTGFDLYGHCSNGKLFLQDHRSTFTGTIAAGSIEIDNGLANIILKKMS